MMLSAPAILRECAVGQLVIEPYEDDLLGPCSYDLRLDIPEPVTFYPLDFKLLAVRERLRIAPGIQGQLGTRSSYARKGLFVHLSAGFLDAGFDGVPTLECLYVGAGSLTLSPGECIVQVAYVYLDQPTDRPYGGARHPGHYQHQQGVTPSVL